MPKILIADDEASMLDFLSLLFQAEGYDVETARSAEAARKALAGRSYDLVLCDILMPDGNGLDLLKEIKSADANAAVIMMTAYTSTKSAIEAMKLGAYDYISKPFDVEELKIVAQKALERAELVDENVYLRRELEQKYTFNNIIGKSPRMQAIFSLVDRVARTGSTILIHGESGTGKELIARAIHYASPRANRRFLSINCGALPENLLESELFGHERGAFTGAVREKKGLFEEADGGTLFLDEIGEMPPTMQVKLLRVLQEKVVRRWAAPPRRRSTCGSSPPPTGTSSSASRPATSARTSTTGSTSSPSTCRRCASGARTSRSSSTSSSSSTASRWRCLSARSRSTR